ncbi:MAG TPA: BTAD domain-containing putative transcriptional regulator [Actinophytocola sp.]|nr:BTAD domain-containing putative transcriptional regulator [Actinophytocola sp.]
MEPAQKTRKYTLRPAVSGNTTSGVTTTPNCGGPPMTPPSISVRLLDGFELQVDDQDVPITPSLQRLLAYLALHDGPVTRTALAAALWPDVPERRASACLRSALWRLVKPPHPLVETGQNRLRIGPHVRVDIAAVRRYAAELAGTGQHPPAPSSPVPVAWLSAELLPGWTDHWVESERAWFREQCLRALEALSERFRVRGDHFHALETAMAAVRGDPLRESAHRRLIQLHLADGNPAAALRQFTAYRSLLRAELGVSPSPEIRRLVEPVLAGR